MRAGACLVHEKDIGSQLTGFSRGKEASAPKETKHGSQHNISDLLVTRREEIYLLCAK